MHPTYLAALGSGLSTSPKCHQPVFRPACGYNRVAFHRCRLCYIGSAYSLDGNSSFPHRR
ncbi:Uncharacterised protein [Vibrio cholerae]|nr:Uncharacterised protein [Vibrio cholerae]CSI46016.1 Uncharacterised protein [Vibrio cholerae]